MTENGAGRVDWIVARLRLEATHAAAEAIDGPVPVERIVFWQAADEIERLRAALVRYGDALDELTSPCEGVDTIHTMAERARQTINPELCPPVKPSVIP